MSDKLTSSCVAESDPRLRFVPLDKAADPLDGLCDVIKDMWWCVHPERGLIFFALNKRHDGSPQCNSHEQLARSLCAKLYPWADVRYVPIVFRRADPMDYA